MKNSFLVGLLFIFAGFVAAQIFNLWWLYDTIVDIVQHIQTGNVSPKIIAWDIMRVLFRGVVWVVVSFIGMIPGIGICIFSKVRD